MWTPRKIWKRLNASSIKNDDQNSRGELMATTRKKADVSVLFVCMGNICRSPLAEGVLRQHLAQSSENYVFEIDSAGTHSYHEGASPDPRAQTAASRRGIDISDLRARRIVEQDFHRFDYIIAMDRDNQDNLHAVADESRHQKIRLLLDFSRDNKGADVPDPYYGGKAGFEHVLDLVEEAVDSLIAELTRSAVLKNRTAGSR
jgi:protein-tyrosine phosphatase